MPPARLPPLAVRRKGPLPKLAFVGVAGCGAVAVAVVSPWALLTTTFGERAITGTETREGEVMLVCACLAALCFLLMILMRSAILMIPAMLSSALMLGVAITALEDPEALMGANGLSRAALESGWTLPTAVGGAGVALACALVVGWDYRRQ